MRKAVLLSIYDQGRQPFGLASPAAWLRDAGFEVTCADLSVSPMPTQAVREACAVFFFLPMHTATRLAGPQIRKVQQLNPAVLTGAFGLYAPLNAEHLRSLGVEFILGAEFEAGLVRVMRGETEPVNGLEKLAFRVPDRTALAGLERYAKLLMPDGAAKLVGYTEASRGCKHHCRHCPVVPVYNGAFRVVQAETVLADIRQQAARGATHITFGDPDFWNGPTHAMRVVETLHSEFPGMTYDATIKIEHLQKHRELLPRLRDTGCLFVTSAVESLDNQVLEKLEKGHTREDFIATVRAFREHRLTLSPTFIAFHPWTTLQSYRDFLRTIRELQLEGNVAPVQLALRLLLPQGSRLLELPEVTDRISAFDAAALTWPWSHSDPEVDALGRRVFAAVAREPIRDRAFPRVWEIAFGEALPARSARCAIPFLTEPWYC